MLKLISYALAQCILAVGGQVALKIALARMLPFAWSKAFWTSVFLNWQLAVAGILFGSSSILWMYILKHYPFSTAYPLASLSYVFAMIAGMVFFHENITALKWVGTLFIIFGCGLIAK